MIDPTAPTPVVPEEVALEEVVPEKVVLEKKAVGAYRTIGELSRDTGLQQHILRYWETRFPQLKPLQRAGNRRYYRPEDVALVLRIAAMLNEDGYTIRGVQQALLAERKRPAAGPRPITALDALLAVRTSLVDALEEDALA